MVFGLQGVGKLTYDALLNLDLPIIMTTVMYASFFVVDGQCARRRRLYPARSAREDCVMLEVRDLKVSFRTEHGSVAPSTASPSTWRRARSWAWSANRDRARRLSLLAVMGLINDPNAIIEGSIAIRGRELLGLPPREMRKLRGREIAMIFQDPMTALTPGLHDRLADRRADHGA